MHFGVYTRNIKKHIIENTHLAMFQHKYYKKQA